MADAMKCDRCGKYYEIDDKNNSFKHLGCIYVRDFNSLTTDRANRIDLCPDCQDAFEEQMKNKTDWDMIALETTVKNMKENKNE